MVGETWDQKIVEDDLLAVTTSKSQPTKENLRIFEFNTNKKVTYSYQVSLTCVSI